MIVSWETPAFDATPYRSTGQEILFQVAQKHGLTTREIRSPSRRREIAWPRQEAMWEIRRRNPRLSLPQIARLVGVKDHTTVLHGIRAYEARKAKA